MSLVHLSSIGQRPNNFFNRFPNGIQLGEGAQVCLVGYSGNLNTEHNEDSGEQYEMVINQGKTKLMVINGRQEDRMEIVTSNGIIIKHTETYVYLGCPISESGSMTKDLELHAAQNFKHLNKFILFCVKNVIPVSIH